MANRDSMPPPPYSETDSNVVLTPATSANGQSLPSIVSSTSAGSVVHTPGPSPSPSGYQHSVQDNSPGFAVFLSASAYFETRPVQNPVSSQAVTSIKIIVTPETDPRELPYLDIWEPQDVTAQDWATFLNYLLPDHIANVNHDVADRKLRAEIIGDRMHQITLNDEKSPSDLSAVHAQLEPLRSPGFLDSSASAISFTIREWNEHFFIPRGLRIVASDPAEYTQQASTRDASSSAMPSSWISQAHKALSESSKTSKQARKVIFSGLKSLTGMEANSKGFKTGPIVANNNGFRIGSGIVADSAGFRMGNMLVADQNGFKLGGARGIVADKRGLTVGGRSFGYREPHEDQKGGGRGRCGPCKEYHKRRTSTSSSSSSTTNSSSDSISSMGSLPDFDDLRDQQLPMTRQVLENWLNHLDQPITKQQVKNMCQEIKTSKEAFMSQQQQDTNNLRTEVRELLKAFKEIKRAQKKEMRAAKRERRITRRALKKERRLAKKEERQSRREGKKCSRERLEKGLGFPPFTNISRHFPATNHADMIPMQPPVPRPSMMGVFPLGRSTSGPSMGAPMSPQTGFSPLAREPPGLSTLHGNWPFTQGTPYAPGNTSIPSFGDPTARVSRSVEQIHAELLQLKDLADDREARAVELRVAATIDDISEKARLKLMSEAICMEEEAEKFGRETDKLRADCQLLDFGIARELEEEDLQGTQISGVIRH